MVKIESDLLDDAALRKMGIIVVNNEGGGYNYIPSQGDSRSGSEFKEEIEDDMSKAAQIWKNKPGCWQDHFRRAKQFQHYGEFFDPQYGFEQTGYQLAIQTLMNTLSHRDGTYYDPKCFCLHPRDIIGQKLGCMSRLRLNQSQPFNYQYDETHLLMGHVSEDESIKNPFISAALLDVGTARILSLETDCVIPLFDDGLIFPFHLETVDDLCQYPPLKLHPASGQWQYDINIDEQRYWIYTPVKLPSTGNIHGVFKIVHETAVSEYKEYVDDYSIFPVAFIAEFVGPAVADSLCGMGLFAIIVSNCPGATVLGFYHTGTAPFWDVYWGDSKITTVGTGAGEPIMTTMAITSSQSNQMVNTSHSFAVYPKAKPRGRQSYHPPTGKITGPYTPSVVCGDKNPEGSGYMGIHYVYELDEPIDLYWQTPYTEIMFTLKNITPSDIHGYIWYPYGACWVRVSTDGQTYGNFNLDWPTLIIEPGKYVHCRASGFNVQEVTHFRIDVESSPLGWVYVNSQIGVPGGRYECPRDAGPSLWICEPRKNQDD